MAKAMHVTSMGIEGSAAFSLAGTLPMEVPVGQTAFVPSDFAPVSAGITNASLVVITDDPLYPTMRVPLRGTGVAAQTTPVVIAPANGVLDFGSTVYVNDTSAPSKSITFTKAS